MTPSTAAAASKRVPQVGDSVELRIGVEIFQAEIVEDRGPLGVDGERILRIRLDMGPEAEPREFELPESDLVPASPAS